MHKNFHNSYADAKQSAAASGRKTNSIETAKRTQVEAEPYLNCCKTYTKFEQNAKKFRRLVIESYQLNEIRSVVPADMQQPVRQDGGMRCLCVADDALSPAKKVLQAIIKANKRKRKLIGIFAQSSQPEKLGRSGARISGKFCKLLQ